MVFLDFFKRSPDESVDEFGAVARHFPGCGSPGDTLGATETFIQIWYNFDRLAEDKKNRDGD